MDEMYDKQCGQLRFSKHFFETCLSHHFPLATYFKVEAAQWVDLHRPVRQFKYATGSEQRILGLSRYQVVCQADAEQVHFDILIKSKKNDQAILQGLSSAISGDEMGDTATVVEQLKTLEYAQMTSRELAVFELQPHVPALQALMPKTYGIFRNISNNDYIILEEYLHNTDLTEDNTEIGYWDNAAIIGAIDSYAQLHAIWYDKKAELKNFSWLAQAADSKAMVKLMGFWQQVALDTDRYVGQFISEEDFALHLDLVKTLPSWWAEIDEFPQTLIYNDNLPRNLGVRHTNSGKKLALFDWTVATIHLPQRDLCELFCYILPGDITDQEIIAYIDRHRQQLQLLITVNIPQNVWYRGFLLALYDFLVHRFALQLRVLTKMPRPEIPAAYHRLMRLINLMKTLEE